MKQGRNREKIPDKPELMQPQQQPTGGWNGSDAAQPQQHTTGGRNGSDAAQPQQQLTGGWNTGRGGNNNNPYGNNVSDTYYRDGFHQVMF